MAIDVNYLLEAIQAATKESVENGLLVIQARAQQLVPVRKLYKSGRGKRTYILSGPPTTMSARQLQKAAARHGSGLSGVTTGAKNMQSYWKNRAGRQIIPEGRSRATVGSLKADVLRTKVTRGGRTNRLERGIAGQSIQKERIGGTIRGRVNSYAPVINSPIGVIGGEELRHWAGKGVMEIKVIHAEGKSFELTDLMTSRGRYEMTSGRAVRTVDDKHGEPHQVIGGRLHDSIQPSDVFSDGAETYGFVSASAVDPFSKTNHDYAPDQEFGSRHNRAHPFLRPALRESRRTIMSTTRGPIQRAFQSGVRPDHNSASARPIVLEVQFDSSGFRNAYREVATLWTGTAPPSEGK